MMNAFTKKRVLLCIAITTLFLSSSSLVLQADHNRILQQEYRGGISRHIACDSLGYCYLLLPTQPPYGESSFTLNISNKPHPQNASDFAVTIPLSGLIPEMTERVFSAGLSIDPDGMVHLVWTTNNGQLTYSVANSKELRQDSETAKWLNPETLDDGALVISPKQSWAGDICQGPKGRTWLAWTTESADSDSTVVHLGTAKNGKWLSYEVGIGKKLYPPSMAISEDDNTFIIACGDTLGFTHTVQGKLAELGSDKRWNLIRSHSGNRPALADLHDSVLAVHESGDSLKYTILRSNQVARTSHPLTDLDDRLIWDTVHSPRLVIDQHDVPWMFFIDSTRQHIFYSRWLGTQWSPILNGPWLTRNTARFESNHLDIDWLSVRSGFGKDNSSIALSFGNQGQPANSNFELISTPSLTADNGSKTLFLDLKEVKEVDGVSLTVNTANKVAEPVIVGGTTGDFDSQGASKIAVHKQEGIYRAWYTGMHREPGSQWPKSGAIPYVRVGYAESPDGVHFKKKPLGLSAFGKNEDTNIVAGLPATPLFRPIVPNGMHIDTNDSDPSRRYKLLTWTSRKPDRILPNPTMDDEQTWTLWTSADGLRWNEASKGGIRFPGGMPSSFSPQSMFYDATEPNPAKKYKAYGFIGLNNDRRGAGYGYSSDAVEWIADSRNPVFDPAARATPVVRGGKVQQIHDASVFKYHEYYLAFYQYQRHGHEMTVELAMSRDGETFVYIQPGSEVVRRGDAGEWDSDMIGPSQPLIDDHEIKVYYSGYRFSETDLIEGEHACGLATLRLDGFTHMKLDQGRDEGFITTIPVDRGTAIDLFVNASCTGGSSIEVELVDPKTAKPLPHFTRSDCTIIKSDSLAHKITWGKRNLTDVAGDSFQIRFYLAGQDSAPELYSFEFR